MKVKCSAEIPIEGRTPPEIRDALASLPPDAVLTDGALLETKHFTFWWEEER